MKKFLVWSFVALIAAPLVAQDGGAGSAPQSSEEIKITAEIKIGTAIENRNVVGESTSFGPDVTEVVGWSRITGAAQPTEITHVWKRNGDEVSKVPLNVQSASFRTYSRKSVAGLPGNWTFEVRDNTGATIASQDFTVGNDASAPAAGASPDAQ